MTERTSRRAFLAGAAAGVAGIAGCSGEIQNTTTATSTTTSGSPAVTAPTRVDETESPVAWRWTFDVPLMRPVALDGTVAVTTAFEGSVDASTPMEELQKGAAAAFEPSSGERAWFKNLPRPALGPAFVHDGRLFQAAGWHGETDDVYQVVRALDGAGGITWRHSADGRETLDLLAVGSEGIFVGTRSGEYGAKGHETRALRYDDGSVSWRASTGDVGDGALAGDALLVERAGPTQHVTAFAARGGANRWGANVTLLTGPNGEAVADGSVAALAVPGEEAVRGYDVTSGNVVWTYPNDSGASVTSDRTLVVPVGSTVAALDPATGAARWTVDLDASPADAPLVTDDAVYVATENGTAHAFALADGSERWQADAAGTRPVATAGDRVLFHTLGGGSESAIRAHAIADGSRHWSFERSGSMTRPTVVDGSVFTAATDGAFLAFE